MGGADLLKVFNVNSPGDKVSYLDKAVIRMYEMLPIIMLITIGLIILTAVLIALHRMGIKAIKPKGITNEIFNIKGLRERDEFIIKVNKILRRMTDIVQRSIFRLADSSKDYYEYNIKRAGLSVPGGFRMMTAEEFNAIVVIAGVILVAISLVILLINPIFGVVVGVASIFAVSSLPMLIIRMIVADRDREIRENFMDLYLMLHYVLLSGGGTPLTRIFESYAKTTNSEEMKRFVNNCIGHIDIHGEYNATKLIAKDYREIPEVNKLMRLIRQMYDGGEISQELMGFREEIIKDRKYLIEKKMNRLVNHARLSFNLLMIVLVQAILSAMSIYLPDLKLMTSIFGK